VCTLQRVINLLKNVNPSIRTYVVCLMLSNGRKNCADMARSVGISPKPLYAYLLNARMNSIEIENMLFSYAKETRSKGVKRTLVLDPTAIIKRYASSIENLCHDRDGCTRHVERVLVPIYASVVDENIKIPLCLDFWVQQKVTGKKRYKSKVKITQDLIEYLKHKGLEFDFVSLDGAFPTPDMFVFFKKTGLKFIMRIPRSRCITTKDERRMQLKHCPDLKLKKNSREKTIQAKLYGDSYFFTAHKRQCKDGGWEVIFLVSNMNLSAKDQVAAFNLRWPMEKINRTTKQKFGSTQCQALKASKQQAHIMACFLAHSILELAQNDKQKKNVDEMVNFLRKLHFNDLLALIINCESRKTKHSADLVAKKFQKHFQNLHNNAYESSGFYA
jgi:hypothetical protein